MVFKSVFDSLSEVREQIEQDRIDPTDVVLHMDKYSITITLVNSDDFFEEYVADEYYMSPGSPHRDQVLVYKKFGRPQELCLELLSNFFDGELKSMDYRGSSDSTDIL